MGDDWVLAEWARFISSRLRLQRANSVSSSSSSWRRCHTCVLIVARSASVRRLRSSPSSSRFGFCCCRCSCPVASGGTLHPGPASSRLYDVSTIPYIIVSRVRPAAFPRSHGLYDSTRLATCRLTVDNLKNECFLHSVYICLAKLVDSVTIRRMERFQSLSFTLYNPAN